MRYKILRWKIIKILGNLNVSITLLLIIALTSIAGTIIEQNKNIEYYQTKYPINNNNLLHLNWESIIKYKLNDLYTSWPFLFLLFIFSLSLIICTFSTQLPSLKHARRWKMKKNLNTKNILYNQITFKDNTFCIPIYALTKKQYYTFYQQDTMYSYKGLYGRIAPIAVHFSIILLLCGSIGSLFSSFYIQAMVPVGETFSLHNITNSGLLSKIPEHINGKVNDFQIEYYQNLSVKQFRSNIELYDNQKNIKVNKTIAVNEPLKFENLTIYQTDWKVNGLRIQLDSNKTIQIPVTEVPNNKSYWFTSIIYQDNKRLSFIISGLQDEIRCYDNEGQLIQSLRLAENYTIDSIPIQILSILTSTGLQIKADQGVELIYTSFGLMMISIAVSYLSFSQLWIGKNCNIIDLGGKTNRAQLNFEEDISYVQKYLEITK
uniref:Cytochrome c biogenesis protein Ccs1 n=1 Tax=Helminthora furcellata TaxID=1884666 RepID=A0A1G4NQU5_9FLOR|nr:Cytochrome c biogenesis protein ccs1 [Helminthora furcellata]SCW21047.1 Cytochrome c biogenesis protein ccs1 [Helminthora furcellata]SCW23907.1 Cytochrome c biogenesis protein ccs1 [Helminthora furcellata]